MNRSKILPRILIILIFGFMCFGFISAVQAARVNTRPIEHWLLNNPTGSGGNYVNVDYAINIGNPFLRPIFLDEIFLVEGETTYDGFIKERVLNDGTAQLTVHLWVNNAPLTVYSYPEFFDYIMGSGPRPNAIIGAYVDGYIDYKFQCTFNLPSPGMDIPNIWDMIFSGVEISSQVIGKGYGTFSEFTEPFFTEGAEGMVTLNQRCLIKPQLEGLKINKLYGTELWPIELINIQQIE